jgi:hypothetical protein
MSFEEIFSLKNRLSLTPFRDKKIELNVLTLSPDETFLGVTHQEGEVAIFDTRTHKRVHREQSPIENSGSNWTVFLFQDWFSWGMIFGQHTGRALPGRALPDVSFLHKYKEMHGIGPGGRAMLQNGSTNCPMYLCEGETANIFLTFPPDEYWSVRGSWSEPCQRGVFLEELWIDGNDFIRAQVSVVNAKGVRLHTWELNDGNQSKAGEHYCATIDPKGSWVAAGGTEFKGIKVWDLTTKTMRRYTADDDIFSLGASPDGRFVVGVTGRAAILWEIGKEKPVHKIIVKTGNCYSVAWSKDALYVLTKTKILFWKVDASNWLRGGR